MWVNTVHVDGRVTSVENDKTGGPVGQCGSRILAIIDTKEFRVASAQCSRRMLLDRATRSRRPPSRLLSNSMTTTARSLQSSRYAPEIDGLNSLQHMFACEGDVITCLACWRTRPLPQAMVRRASGSERWFFSGGTCQR